MSTQKIKPDHKIKKSSGQTGREANSNRRTKRFEIRFTTDEWLALQDRAAAAGASSTAIYARDVLLPSHSQINHETRAEHKLRVQLLASLGKIGSNINQIARSLNRLKVWNDTTKDIFQELTKTQEAVTKIAEVFRGRK